MKALHLPQNPLQNISRKATDLLSIIQKIKPQRAQKYISEALNEGIKQNLSGTEIDTEFLVLTLRSYVSRFFYSQKTKNV